MIKRFNKNSPKFLGPQQQPYSAHYAEQGGMGMPKNQLGFTDQTIRAQFVRKVFTMVAIMVGISL